MNAFLHRLSALAPWIALGAGLLALTLGAFFGIAFAVLLLAGVAFAGVLLLLWNSVNSLAGDTPLSLDEAIGYGAPSAEEEQKRAIFRALKDLEFERGVGKISDEDFREYSARYRAEAKRLIVKLDDNLAAAQKLAENLAAQRLREAGIVARAEDAADTALAETTTEQAIPPEAAVADVISADSSPNATNESTDRLSPAEGAALASVCPACNTNNDADALFCKRCGGSLSQARPTAADSTEDA